MRLNYLHEQTQRKNIVLKSYINTDDNVADIQTKLLAIPKFEKFKDTVEKDKTITKEDKNDSPKKPV